MTPPRQFLRKHHYLFRRLHSLTGLVPIGLFLVGHLVTNSTILWGAASDRAAEHVVPPEGASDVFVNRVGTFAEEVTFINGLPMLLLIEVTLWASIAFHAVLGVYYARTGRSNTDRYPHQDNWRYTLQRWTGYIAIFFIFYHIATLRWGWSFLVPGGTEWSHEFAASTAAAAIQGSTEGLTWAGMLVSLGYFIGITASVFHFANGLWTAAITWGLTISAPAQRRWGYVCTAIGAGMMLMAWGSLFGFATLDYENARAVEAQLVGQARPEGAQSDAAAAASEGSGGGGGGEGSRGGANLATGTQP